MRATVAMGASEYCRAKPAETRPEHFHTQSENVYALVAAAFGTQKAAIATSINVLKRMGTAASMMGFLSSSSSQERDPKSITKKRYRPTLVGTQLRSAVEVKPSKNTDERDGKRGVSKVVTLTVNPPS
jgi:hypothetical protein